MIAKKKISAILSIVLAVCMLVCIFPISSLAITYDTSKSGNYYNVISKKDYVLCNGATESEIVLNNANGSRRQVLHVVEVDPSNSNVAILPSYYGIDKDLSDSANWKSEIMSKQVQYYTDVLGYNVVAAMNTSLSYDTEAPYSVLVYNGTLLADGTTHPGAATWLGVYKNTDGSCYVELHSSSEFSTEYAKGNLWQAIPANFGFTVNNGELVNKTVGRSDDATRSMLGIKEDGTLVICECDGRMAPTAYGLSSYELGETMLALGCKWAVNGDGGGSSTFLSKREGESEVVLRCVPSDGAERATINGIQIVSTAAPTGIFDHVSITAENEYVTPGSPVNLTVLGVDSAGGSAVIPEGITYSATLGSVSNGVFTSDGTAGDAVISAYHNSELVGSTTVHVVIPTRVQFNSPSMTVPYGKTIKMGMRGFYGTIEMAIKGSDFTYTLTDPSIGTVDGFSFTGSSDETKTQSEITATLTFDTEVTASSVIKLGKGSEIIYDFEDNDTHGFFRSTNANYNYISPLGDVEIADSSTGHVRNGNYAMAVTVDYGNSTESGFMLATLVNGETHIFKNASKIGMWMYIPDDAYAVRIDPKVQQFNNTTEKKVLTSTGGYFISDIGETKDTQAGFAYALEESGWHYVTVDVSSYEYSGFSERYTLMQIYISQKDGANGYKYAENKSLSGKFVFYIDDITVDYSDAVDDREPPVFSGINYAVAGMDESTAMNGQTINENTLSFTAQVAENTVKDNFTGIDTASGKVYIDTVDYTASMQWSGGKMSLNNVTLAEGKHTVKFCVCDNMGNYGSVVRTINIAGTSPVKVVAHDSTLNRILLGSLYYTDIVAENIENVKSVTVQLDLDCMSTWELDHMIPAAGFAATYTLIEDENIATVTVTRTGENTQSGEAVLVSMPVRAWQLKITTGTTGTTHEGIAWSYEEYRQTNEVLPVEIRVNVDGGKVTYLDNSFETFGGNDVAVDTEMFGSGTNAAISQGMRQAATLDYYNSWNGGHDHRVEMAEHYPDGCSNYAAPVAVADKAATCTEDGYTGRTYCELCQSVADWGTTIPAAGHSYELVNGKFVCSVCGDEYVTGTGLFTVNGKNYYSILGNLVFGWQQVDEAWYYFGSDYAAYTGNNTVDGRLYNFGETGAITGSQWFEISGNKYYYFGPGFLHAGGTATIHICEIDGNTYGFDRSGRMITGLYIGLEGYGSDMKLYYFDETGIKDDSYTCEDGAIVFESNVYYVKNSQLFYAGLINYNGDYYYISGSLTAVKNGTFYVSKNNDLLSKGYYEFGADGKMVLLNGINGNYYYVSGVPTYAGLVLVEGDYYYACSDGHIAKNGTFYVNKNNDILSKGYYEFGADGKMVRKNGIDGGYYYVNGVPTYAGLILIEGDYYYACSDGHIAQNGTRYINKNNDLLNKGYYEFGADGKMLLNNGIRGGYYYVNGVPTYAGLILIEGDYYYACSDGHIAQNGTRYINKNNDLLDKGYYEFGADGKMLLKNGISGGYYYVNGVPTYAGLVLIEGDYYYASSDGHLAVNGRFYVNKNNDLLSKNYYTFNAEGKLVLN